MVIVFIFKTAYDLPPSGDPFHSLSDYCAANDTTAFRAKLLLYNHSGAIAELFGCNTSSELFSLDSPGAVCKGAVAACLELSIYRLLVEIIDLAEKTLCYLTSLVQFNPSTGYTFQSLSLDGVFRQALNLAQCLKQLVYVSILFLLRSLLLRSIVRVINARTFCLPCLPCHWTMTSGREWKLDRSDNYSSGEWQRPYVSWVPRKCSNSLIDRFVFLATASPNWRPRHQSKFLFAFLSEAHSRSKCCIGPHLANRKVTNVVDAASGNVPSRGVISALLVFLVVNTGHTALVFLVHALREHVFCVRHGTKVRSAIIETIAIDVINHGPASQQSMHETNSFGVCIALRAAWTVFRLPNMLRSEREIILVEQYRFCLRYGHLNPS